MKQRGCWIGLGLLLAGCNLSYVPATPSMLSATPVPTANSTTIAQVATLLATQAPTLAATMTTAATHTPTETLTVTLSSTFTPTDTPDSSPTTTMTPTTSLLGEALRPDEPVTRANTPLPPAITGQVAAGRGGLRLRQYPETGAILFSLPELTRLEIQGRTTNNAWLLVKIPEGFLGWVSSRYIVGFDMNAVTIIQNPQPVAYVVPTAPPNAPAVASNITVGTRTIYARGQTKGNRRNVFTTIGDSISDTDFFLRYIPSGYNLQSYGYLLPTLQYYLTISDLPGTSYNHGSMAARAGWSTQHLLDVGQGCGGGNIPIVCELRATKPAVALVLIGTNDLPNSSAQEYGGRLQRIVEIIIEEGTVPVLSTLPARVGYAQRVNEYNQQVIAIARRFDIPLWDLNRALATLPNQGLDADGIHLSIPPGGLSATTDFTAENLRYGTTMRNLTALQILNTLLQQGLN